MGVRPLSRVELMFWVRGVTDCDEESESGRCVDGEISGASRRARLAPEAAENSKSELQVSFGRLKALAHEAINKLFLTQNHY